MVLNRYPLSKVISYISMDTTPPLYAISLKLFTMVFGDKLWTARLLSLIVFSFNFYLILYPVRKLYNEKVSYILACLMLTSQMAFFASTEIRNYAFSFTFSFASLIYGLLLLRDGKLKDSILYIIFCGLCSYSHGYCSVFVFILNICLLVTSIINKKNILKILISNVIIAFIFSFWIKILFSQAKGISSGFWILKPSMMEFEKTFKYIFSDINIINIIFVVIILIGIVFLIKNKQKNFIIPIITSIGTLLLFIIYSYYKTPMYITKYVTTVGGCLYLILAIILSNTKKPFYILYLLLLIIPFIGYYNTASLKNDDSSTKKWISMVNKNFSKQKVFYHDDEFSIGMSEYYFPGSIHYLNKNTSTVVKTIDMFGDIRYISKFRNIPANDYIYMYQGGMDNYNVTLRRSCMKKYGTYENNYYGNMNVAVFRDCEIENK